LLSLCFVSNGYTQSVVRSNVGSGGSSQLIITNKSSYFISQSIGQSSVIGTSRVIRQGFQQPPTLFIIEQSGSKNEYLASVYPNPFSHAISVAFEKEVTKDITISIHDINGRMVHHQNYSPAQLIKFSLQDIANGSYIIHVLIGPSRFTTSIIKL
jgi:hypothetical protein